MAKRPYAVDSSLPRLDRAAVGMNSGNRAVAGGQSVGHERSAGQVHVGGEIFGCAVIERYAVVKENIAAALPDNRSIRNRRIRRNAAPDNVADDKFARRHIELGGTVVAYVGGVGGIIGEHHLAAVDVQFTESVFVLSHSQKTDGTVREPEIPAVDDRYGTRGTRGVAEHHQRSIRFCRTGFGNCYSVGEQETRTFSADRHLVRTDVRFPEFGVCRKNRTRAVAHLHGTVAIKPEESRPRCIEQRSLA